VLLLLKAVGPEEGDRIEFLSDRLTDKGPADGTIKKVKTTVDGLYITVDFGGHQESFSWDDLEEAGADKRGRLWLVKSFVRGHQRRMGGKTIYVRQHARNTPPGGEPEHHAAILLPVAADPAATDTDQPSLPGFKQINSYTWGRTINAPDGKKRTLYNIRLTAAGKFRLSRSVSFPGTGISGAPTQEIGFFDTAEEVVEAFRRDSEASRMAS
jgi:hypothetical protein